MSGNVSGKMTLEEISDYAPDAGYEPPAPGWKSIEAFRPYLPGAAAGAGADEAEVAEK